MAMPTRSIMHFPRKIKPMMKTRHNIMYFSKLIFLSPEKKVNIYSNILQDNFLLTPKKRQISLFS